MSDNKKITPYYLINTYEVEIQYNSFIKAINNNNIVAYSIKANYDKKIIETLNKQGSWFEVCSKHEFFLLKKYNIDPKKIIINGIIQNKSDIETYIKEGALVIIDSMTQLEWIANMSTNCNIGIRCNLDYIKNNSMYIAKSSRFGLNTNKSLFEFLKHHTNINLICLHCHFSGNTRNPIIYKNIINELCRIIRKNELTTISILDIGGGYKIDSKYWNYNDYSHVIKSTLKTNNMEYLRIIVEPGNALVRTSCSYYTKVIDKKITTDNTYIIVDGSILHLCPNGIKRKYDSQIKYNSSTLQKKQTIVGCTCKESDVLIVLENVPAIEIGDIIRFDNMGAYVLNELSPYIIDLPRIYYI